MLYTLQMQIADWPRPARYVYYIISNLRFLSYSEWRGEGEPNPFVRHTRRRRVTSEKEIADIFRMTSRELAAFGKAQSGSVPDRSPQA